MKKYYYRSGQVFIALLGFFLVSSTTEAQQIEIGNDSTISVFSPICRSRDYSVYEIIYLSSDINITGNITAFAFERHDGSNVDPIQNMSLYMMHTSATSLANSNYSHAGYQLVYQGAWPNDAGSGWREVVLSTPFSYDGTSNLQVLAVKGYEAAVANQPVAPRWRYTNIVPAPDRARRYYGNVAIDSLTALTTIEYSANARLTFGPVGVKELTSSPVSVFPNPVRDVLSINIHANAESENFIFELMDFSGRLVSGQSINGSVKIPVSHLPDGIYYYMLRSDDAIWSEKLIISK